MKLGIQLFTLRTVLKEDFFDTLRHVASMGYEAVEFAWDYGGLAPDALADMLAELKLACCGIHMSIEELRDPDSVQYAYAKAMGSRWVTVSQSWRVAAEWDAAIADVNAAARVACDNGLTLSYHNHAEEMTRCGSGTALDALFERTVDAGVAAEIDVGWVLKGGGDPVAVVDRWGARAHQIHMKDFSSEGIVTEVGNGCLPLAAVVRAAQRVGATWLIVEQDSCPVSELDSARISLANLRAALGMKGSA